MRVYFFIRTDFFTIFSNPQNFWLHRATVLGKPVMGVLEIFPRLVKQIKNLENFLILKSITKLNKIVFLHYFEHEINW